jgi:dipeptidyl aminopeptidase/acylaminoacyl peptidase
MTGLSIAIAPDAHAIVIEAPWHSGDSRLFLRRLNGSDLVPLPGTEGAHRPFWSPDSHAIAFFADRRLKRVDLDDGSVRDICPADLVHSAAWGAGGTILFATTEGPIRRVQASGGTPTPLPLDDSVAEARQVAPVFVAGSRRFLYTSIRSDGSARVRLASLDDDRRLEFPGPGRRIVWAGNDRVIFTQASVLSVQRVDYEAPAFLGEPDAIATDLDVGWIGSRETVSDAGIVAFIQRADRTRQFSWYSRSGGTGQPIGPPGEYMTFDLSPDDRRIAANVRKVNRNDIWIIDAARGSTSPLTAGDSDNVDPRWSPDSRDVLFGSTRDPSRSPFRAALNGEPPSRLFQYSGRTFALDDWSPDGRWVLFHDALESVLHARLVDPTVPAGETRDQDIVVARPLKGGADQTRMSPDGRWIAYNSNESGRPEVYVVPFPPTGDRFQLSPQGGVQPLWRSDGRELFFLSLDGTIMSASVGAGPSFTTSEPVALFKARVQPVTELIEQYAVNRDGTRFLVLEPPIAAKGPVVQVIANWEAAADRSTRR